MALNIEERREAEGMQTAIAAAQVAFSRFGTRFNVLLDQDVDNESPFQADITMAKVRAMATRLAGHATVLATALTTE
jgi:hypothetical protein